MAKGTRGRQNVLIRKHVVGGDDVLDAIALVHRVRERLDERDLAGQTEAREAYDALERLRAFMYEIARERVKNNREITD